MIKVMLFFVHSMYFYVNKKNNTMKYNITKSDVTTNKQILKFIGRGLSVNEAVDKLYNEHGNECCRMFQDVSDIIIDDDNVVYFEVINNKRKYRYELEVDSFIIFSVFRPKTSIVIDIINHKN